MHKKYKVRRFKMVIDNLNIKQKVFFANARSYPEAYTEPVNILQKLGYKVWHWSDIPGGRVYYMRHHSITNKMLITSSNNYRHNGEILNDRLLDLGIVMLNILVVNKNLEKYLQE